MTHWNHRVMHRKVSGEDWYEIHEVYYDNYNKPDGWTKESVAPGGETIEELKEELHRMIECLDKPVLEYEGK